MRVSVFRRLRFALSSTIAVVLVLLAIALSLARVAIVHAPQFRAELEAVLAEVIEQPLTLGGLRARWTGRHPTLVLEDVRLQRSGLEVDELEISLDLLLSLRERELRPAEVAVSGLALTAVYDADGRLRLTRVGNADIADFRPGEGPAPDLPADVHLRAAKLELIDTAGNRSYRFPQVDLWLSNTGHRYSLAGHIELPEVFGRSARFRAEWTHAPLTPIEGQLYVDARRLNLESISELLQRQAAMPLLAGRADGELWFSLRGARLQEVSGRLKGRDLRGRGHAEADWQPLAARLGGQFRWQGGDNGWELAARDLEYSSEYRVWPKNQLALRLTRRAGTTTLSASTGYIRLDDIRPALGLLPLPQEARRRLLALQPQGQILAPRGQLVWGANGLNSYRLQSRFRGLSFAAVDGVPGAQGLDGSLALDERGGQLALESHRGQLDFAGLFRQPIDVHRLRAEVGWQLSDKGWRVEAPAIRLENADAKAVVGLRLFSSGGGSPMLDLRGHLQDGNGAAVSRYLPTGILKPELVSWLDSALRGGQVPRAEVVLFGPLDRFPYDDGSGVFDVQAQVVDAALNYMPDWPELTALNGHLRFVGSSMDISASSGRTLGAQIKAARIRVEDFKRPRLKIDGRVRGSGSDLLGFLRQSPLGASVRDELAGIALGGVHELKLRAEIPLDDPGKPRVAGTINLNKGDLSIPRWNVALRGLQGPVRFTERGISSPGVRARYKGRPITLFADTGVAGDRERIQLTTQLQASPQELLTTPQLPVASGMAAWNLELLFPAFQAEQAAPALVLRLASDLRGVAVDLPAPLGKPAIEPRLLELELQTTDDGLAPIAIDYGHDLRALVELSGEELELTRAALRLGSGEPTLPAGRGIDISGNVPVLDLDAWRARLAQVQNGSGAKPALPLAVQLQADQLRLMGLEFAQTGLQLQRRPKAWQLDFTGPTLAGAVSLPDEPAAVVSVALERLRIEQAREPSRAAGAPGTGQDIPPLDLSVTQLSLGDEPLGALKLRLRPVPGGMSIEEGSLRGPLLEAELEGGWDRAGTLSRLDVTLSSINAGRALGLFGYADALRGGIAEGVLSMNWPGGPGDFSLAKISGQLDLSVMNGQVLSVEPGAGRLFGLLSIAELPRRLSLNFSDLFSKGFSFDRIEAHLRMDSGDAFTRLFYMQGPAARVDLSGRIGLGSRDYDQTVTVTPHVSTALPAVGALAGGPVGAVVAFVAQKVLEDQIDKLTRFRYRVSGSWDEPDIEPLNPPRTPVDPAITSPELPLS